MFPLSNSWLFRIKIELIDFKNQFEFVEATRHWFRQKKIVFFPRQTNRFYYIFAIRIKKMIAAVCWVPKGAAKIVPEEATEAPPNEEIEDTK